jgi:hypothetical protein
MSHQSESKYPARLSYVLKLRGDATSTTLAGRLENVVTGHRVEFASAHELLDAIAHEIDASAGDPPAE